MLLGRAYRTHRRQLLLQKLLLLVWGQQTKRVRQRKGGRGRAVAPLAAADAAGRLRLAAEYVEFVVCVVELPS